MEEIWKDIEGYEGLYQISNLGRVKSLERYIKHYKGGESLHKEKIRRINLDSLRGYQYIFLCKDGKTKFHRVHRLVANSFIDNPTNFSDVNHIDECKTNNNVDNLVWCSTRENTTYSKKNKTSKFVGVSYNYERKKWVAQILFNKKTINLGRFKTEIEAHQTYQNYCKDNNIINKYS